MRSDAFSIIKGRYLVFIWLLPLIYMPGIEFFTHFLLDAESEWFWYDIIYFYYYHTFVALSVFLLTYIGKPNVKLMFRKFHHQELSPSLNLTAFTFIFSIATAFLLFYPLSFIVPEFVQYWFIDLPPFIYSSNDSYPLIPNLLSFISLVLIAPFLEEFIFRGLLLHRWQKKYGLRYAILFSSLLFGFVHPDPIGATAFGIAMCILYLRTQTLWIPVICHAIYNLSVWLVTAAWYSYYGADHIYTLQDFQDEWLIGISTIIITFVWINHYMHQPKSKRTWILPNA